MKNSWLIAKIILRKNIRSPIINIPILLFPIAELLLFGFMDKTDHFISSSQNTFIFGTMLWIAIYRSQLEICDVIFDDISAGNLKNILSAPVTIFQYVCGVVISSFLKLIPVFVIFFVASQILFGFLSNQSGYVITYALTNFIIFGWTIGIVTSGFALIFGSKINFLTWFSTIIIHPFLSMYYEVSKMDRPFDLIGKLFPTNPVATSLLTDRTITVFSFLTSLLFNLIYLALALFLLHVSMKIAMKKGVFYYQ